MTLTVSLRIALIFVIAFTLILMGYNFCDGWVDGLICVFIFVFWYVIAQVWW